MYANYHKVFGSVISGQENWNNTDTCQAVGIKPVALNNENDIRIYPNPIREALQVEVSDFQGGEYSMRIFNLLGQRLLSFAIRQPVTELDLSGLSRGIYYYVLQNKHLIRSAKLTKM